MKEFYFINPRDLMPMYFATLEEAVSQAGEYIGQEDWEAETIERVSIWRRQLVQTVTKTPQEAPAP